MHHDAKGMATVEATKHEPLLSVRKLSQHASPMISFLYSQGEDHLPSCSCIKSKTMERGRIILQGLLARRILLLSSPFISFHSSVLKIHDTSFVIMRTGQQELESSAYQSSPKDNCLMPLSLTSSTHRAAAVPPTLPLLPTLMSLICTWIDLL